MSRRHVQGFGDLGARGLKGIIALKRTFPACGKLKVTGAIEQIVGAAAWTPNSADGTNVDTLSSIPMWVRGLSESQRAAAVEVAKAVETVKAVTHALGLATAAPKTQLSQLEYFQHEASSRRRGPIISAITDVLGVEIRDHTAKRVLEVVAAAGGLALETMLPILKIATLTYDLQKKLRESQERFKRSDVDELLYFSDFTNESTTNERETVEQLQRLRDAMFNSFKW